MGRIKGLAFQFPPGLILNYFLCGSQSISSDQSRRDSKFRPKMLAAFTSPYLPIQHQILPRRRYKLYTTSAVSRANFRLCALPSASDYDREEVRWVREEQRWLREENRWLREEERWRSEREMLLNEITELKGRIEAMEMMMRTRRSSSSQGVAETVANLASILQGLKKEVDFVGRIAESGDGPSPIVLEEVEKEKEVVVKEIRVLESEIAVEVEKKKVKRKVLKIGAEGEEVKALQVIWAFHPSFC